MTTGSPYHDGLRRAERIAESALRRARKNMRAAWAENDIEAHTYAEARRDEAEEIRDAIRDLITTAGEPA